MYTLCYTIFKEKVKKNLVLKIVAITLNRRSKNYAEIFLNNLEIILIGKVSLNFVYNNLSSKLSTTHDTRKSIENLLIIQKSWYFKNLNLTHMITE